MNHTRKLIALFIILISILACGLALADGSVSFVDLPEIIRPGKGIRISFSVTLPGDADVKLKSESGAVISVLQEDYPAKAGRNNFSWDAMDGSTPIPAGSYILEVTQGDLAAAQPIQIGEISPILSKVMAHSNTLTPGGSWYIQGETNQDAVIIMMVTTQEDEQFLVYEASHPAGSLKINWDGYIDNEPLPSGDYVILLRMTDHTGFSASDELFHIFITEPADQGDVSDIDDDEIREIVVQSGTGDRAPTDFSPYPCEHEVCYWNLPMGELNEEAIWAAMMQPMTVLKTTLKDNGDRQIVKLYEAPDENSKAIGEVTCVSQGVHVLEELDNGWTLVEAYSSSVKKGTVHNYAGFFQGYIKTSRLEQKMPNPKHGLLLDKLNQTMYIFEEGKIISQLPISTGLPNAKQPYNETPAGEFMVVSWTGGFWSGNMFCDLALRINAGILIHEVPCLIGSDGVTRNYTSFARELGNKASHGCIRVPVEKNEDGINMRWLWDNLKLNTRVLIWDDVGRNIPIPDKTMAIYYNPNGGVNYHADEYCSAVKNRYLPLTGFTYGELENAPYDKLTPCTNCKPPKRASEIEALNAANN